MVAVKGVDGSRFRNIQEVEQIQEEMSVLSSLKHPNIIRLYDVHFQVGCLPGHRARLGMPGAVPLARSSSRVLVVYIDAKAVGMLPTRRTWSAGLDASHCSARRASMCMRAPWLLSAG